MPGAPTSHGTRCTRIHMEATFALQQAAKQRGEPAEQKGLAGRCWSNAISLSTAITTRDCQALPIEDTPHAPTPAR